MLLPIFHLRDYKSLWKRKNENTVNCPRGLLRGGVRIACGFFVMNPQKKPGVFFASKPTKVFFFENDEPKEYQNSHTNKASKSQTKSKKINKNICNKVHFNSNIWNSNSQKKPTQLQNHILLVGYKKTLIFPRFFCTKKRSIFDFFPEPPQKLTHKKTGVCNFFYYFIKRPRFFNDKLWNTSDVCLRLPSLASPNQQVPLGLGLGDQP